MILFSLIFPNGLSLKNLLVGEKLVKFVNIGTELLYDTEESVLYDTPSSYVVYKTELSKDGESVFPTIGVSQSWRRVGHSGKVYNLNNITSYTTEYSIILDNDGFELNPYTGEVTCTNNTSSSPRNFEINVIITMDNSGDVLTNIIKFTQEEGVPTVTTKYTEWTTNKIIINPTSTLVSAGFNTVTLSSLAEQIRYKNIYINGELSESSPEYQTINIEPTYSVSGEGFTISGSVVNVADRTNVTGDARTGIVTAEYDGVTGTVTITQKANIATVTYDTPNVSLSYNTTKDASYGTVNPTISYTQIKRINYSSDYQEDTSTIKTGATLSYTESTNHTAATVNRSTGIVTWLANTNTRSRYCKVTVTVTLNGVSGTFTATCTQAGDEVESSDSYYTVSLSANRYTSSSDACPPSGGSCYLEWNITKHTTEYWVSGEETTKETIVNATPSFSGSATGFSLNKSTGKVDIAKNATTEYKDAVARSCTYTATYQGASDSVTIYQEEDSVIDSIVELGIYADPEEISYEGGESEIIVECTTYWELASGGSITMDDSAYVKLSKSNSISWATVDNASRIVTISENTSENDRTLTITGKFGSASATCTITQEGFVDYITDYGYPEITVDDYLDTSGGYATITATATNTYASGKTEEVTISNSDITISKQYIASSYSATSGTTISRFSKSGSKLSHTTMGTNIGYDHVIIKANNNGVTSTEHLYVGKNLIESETTTSVSVSSLSYPSYAKYKIYSEISPNIGTVTETYLEVYTSGSKGTARTRTISEDDYTTKFSLTSGTSYFTINSSTGICETRSDNTTGAKREGKVSLVVSYNGVSSNAKTADIYQAYALSATINWSLGSTYPWLLTNSATRPIFSISGAPAYGSASITIYFGEGENLPVYTYTGSSTSIPANGYAYLWAYKNSNWLLVDSFQHYNSISYGKTVSKTI